MPTSFATNVAIVASLKNRLLEATEVGSVRDANAADCAHERDGGRDRTIFGP